MLYPEKVWPELERRRAELALSPQVQRLLDQLGAALERLGGPDRSALEVEQALAAVPWPGALPTPELDRAGGLTIPFPGPVPDSQETLRRWAADVLRGKPSFAADGSQIPPTRDISLPVGLVQVGWYENRHTPEGWFRKNADVRLLTPEDLREETEVEGGFPGAIVNLTRFEMECERLVRYLEETAGQDPPPLVFLDGSLLVSFARQLRPTYRDRYVRAVLRLLETSRETGGLLVGYVDGSYARDLVTMLAYLEGWADPETPDPARGMGLHDGQLVGRVLRRWGDRTPFFRCRRDDEILPLYHEAGQDVLFCYLRTSDGLPARLEIPAWIYETGRHEEVVERVLAECAAGGGGYPYPLETADAVAVLTGEDRERFLWLLQEFARRQGLEIHVRRKTASKWGRRV